ncbi:hypothetical protein ABC766_10090 [Methylobacterium fujisawaense]|uniref:hypothetical protein n=1 Tax=Methylobacterium fujisawaense TaxID=107400 RepID=UPI0031F4CD46
MKAALSGSDHVLSRDVMKRLRQEAARSPRTDVRMATLQRLEEACDDIASGRAREIARSIEEDESLFGPPKRPKINSKSVYHYVKMRARLETRQNPSVGALYWTGPHDSKIRSEPEGMLAYVRARQAEVFGLSRPRPPRTRGRRVDEIIAAIQDVDDRILVMEVLESGYAAEKRYSILTSALRTMPGVDVDALLSGAKEQTRSSKLDGAAALGPDNRRLLQTLVSRLTNERQLPTFGLRYDGRRIRMLVPPGIELVTKDELDLLRSLSSDKP